MSDSGHHPAWKVAGNLIMLCVVLAFTASDFDASELQTLGLFLAGNGLLEKFAR